MTSRTRAALAVALLMAWAAAGRSDEPAAEVAAAKLAYDAEVEKFDRAVRDAFDRREEAARKDGNKAALDKLKLQRAAFDETGDVPFALPKAWDELAARRAKVNSAYRAAIGDHVRGKRDAEAARVEKEWAAFTAGTWKHCDIQQATVVEDRLRLVKDASVTTAREHSGPIEVTLVARTEAENIRIHAYRGAVVIFNWEVNPKELAYSRPDGGDERESGSKGRVRLTPLKPDTFYRLRWRITATGMQVFVNDQLVLNEARKYDLSARRVVEVRCHGSPVEVKEFRVTPVAEK